MFSLELGAFMFKYSPNDLPNIFNDYFIKHSDTHDYQTRHVNDHNLTKNKTKQNKTKQETKNKQKTKTKQK